MELLDNYDHRRWILYGFSFLLTSLVAGTVYGWSDLRAQLIDDGSQLSEATFGAIFTVGSWSNFAGRFFIGFARNRFGTRACTFFCMVCAMLGSLGVALSDPSNAIALGTSMFAIGLGAGVQLCSQPVASLFPNNSGVILSSLSGSFSLSGLVFLVLTIGSRKTSFLVFTFILAVLSIGVLFTYPIGTSFMLSAADEESDTPPMQVKKEEPAPSFSAGEAIELGESSSPLRNPSLSEENSENVAQTQPKKAIEQMMSFEYVLLCTWFAITLLPLQYYIGSIGLQLEMKADDGFYQKVFSIIYSASFVVSFPAGYIADTLGLGIGMALGNAMLSFSLLWLGTVALHLQPVGFVAYSCGRIVLLGMLFSNVGKRFGYENYGILAGTALLVSAIVSLLQFPMIAVAADGSARAVNICCGAVLLLLFPYFYWLHRKEKSIVIT